MASRWHPSAPPLPWLLASLCLGCCVALVLLPVALIERTWREFQIIKENE